MTQCGKCMKSILMSLHDAPGKALLTHSLELGTMAPQPPYLDEILHHSKFTTYVPFQVAHPTLFVDRQLKSQEFQNTWD